MNEPGNDPARARRRRRRLLYLVGLVPSLLLLMVSARIGVLLHHESRAMSAYADGDFEQAREHFAANRVLNPVERWIAPFGEGDARLRASDHAGAVAAFESALERAPRERECMIRVNLALTHESHAESLVEDGDRAEAIDALLRGREALSPCGQPTQLSPEELAELTSEELGELLRPLLERPGEGSEAQARSRLAAAIVDLRLARKLGVQGADPMRPPQQQPPPDDEVTQEKRREVQKGSKDALEDHVKHKDEFDFDAEQPTPSSSPTPQW